MRWFWQKRKGTGIDIIKRKPVQIRDGDSVELHIRDSQGKVKIILSVFPKFEKPPFTDTYKIIISDYNSHFILFEKEI